MGVVWGKDCGHPVVESQVPSVVVMEQSEVEI